MAIALPVVKARSYDWGGSDIIIKTAKKYVLTAVKIEAKFVIDVKGS